MVPAAEASRMWQLSSHDDGKADYARDGEETERASQF
jgi:hypothetical protein